MTLATSAACGYDRHPREIARESNVGNGAISMRQSSLEWITAAQKVKLRDIIVCRLSDGVEHQGEAHVVGAKGRVPPRQKSNLWSGEEKFEATRHWTPVQLHDPQGEPPTCTSLVCKVMDEATTVRGQ